MKVHNPHLPSHAPQKLTSKPNLENENTSITGKPARLTPQIVVKLQRTFGNAFVQRLIAQSNASPPQMQRVLELEEATPLTERGRKIKLLRMTTEKEFDDSVPKAQLGENRWRTLLRSWAAEPEDDAHPVHKYKNITAAVEAAKAALTSKKKSESYNRKQAYREKTDAEVRKIRGRSSATKQRDKNWKRIGKVAHRANLAHLRHKHGAMYKAKLEALQAKLKSGGVIEMPDKSVYRTMLLYFAATSEGITIPKKTVDGKEKKDPIKFKMGDVDMQIANTSKTSQGTVANTHVKIIGTSNTSAYSEQVFKSIPLPIQTPSNRSQQTLNALEGVRNEGGFLPSEVTKHQLLSQGKITPQDAIDPEKYGTYELQGASGNRRDNYADLVNRNTSNLMDISEAKEVEIGKKLKEQFAIIVDEAQKDKHFDAYKQCVRLMDIEIPSITGDDPLTPPSTPQIQEAYNSVMDEEKAVGEKETEAKEMSEDENEAEEEDSSEEEEKTS